MPVPKGGGKKAVPGIIKELHGGATHAKTQAKHGKRVADKQSVAIAMKAAGVRKKRGKK